MFYQKLIKELLGDRDFDPRHIEALAEWAENLTAGDTIRVVSVKDE